MGNKSSNKMHHSKDFLLPSSTLSTHLSNKHVFCVMNDFIWCEVHQELSLTQNTSSDLSNMELTPVCQN